MARPRKPLCPHVSIQWRDSVSPISTWMELDRVGQTGTQTMIQSRGYLVYEDSHWVGLSHSLELVEGVPTFAGGVILIPKACVLYRKESRRTRA